MRAACIRTALGDTGSKSTIAPLLKRWKEERPAEAAAIALQLPPALLDAVRLLYERMDAHASARIDDAALAARAQVEAARADLRSVSGKVEQANADNARLREALDRTEAALGGVRLANQERDVDLASARSGNAALAARLYDRTREVDAHREQMRQTLAQFDHFQRAQADQRHAEHQAFDRRITGQEHELLHLRERAAQLQRTHGELSCPAAAMAERNAALEETLQRSQIAYTALRSERDRFEAEAARLDETNADLGRAMDGAAAELGLARTALAVRERELVLSEERRHTTERELAARTADLSRLRRQAERGDRGIGVRDRTNAPGHSE